MQSSGTLKETLSFHAKYDRDLIMYGDSSFAAYLRINKVNSCQNYARISCRSLENVNLVLINQCNYIDRSWKIMSFDSEDVEELMRDDDDEEDDELCPVECVKEFKTDDEFLKILEKSVETGSLVVVDFYRTACGSCKYIEQGFSKLCKGSGDVGAPVIFLKHNVMDEYDEQSEVAERLRIKTVPLFHFYKNGVLLEAFATRDKEKILAAILKYTAPASEIIQSSI